jgi:hypothetical protein
VSGADNQQERLTAEAIPSELGSFLSGFALGEASFMLVCRRRSDYGRGWKISAAFNVSQKDRVPLELFRDTLGCGSIRRAGNGGWYWEVNRLSEIRALVVPFFERFPLVGKKAEDFARFSGAVALLSKGVLSDSDYAAVLELRVEMNGGGKRHYSAAGILRDYTPTSPRTSDGGMR